MAAYYNEIDPYAAQWLRELILAGHIAPGEVDERSIEDVTPADLMGFTQCHFFAGIGVWSLALRSAGWPDDRPVWTGSCPCQPFSQAGKGEGVADERHLWPAWFWLIEHGKRAGVPVFGEQVASKDGLAWLDIVQADMEGAGYAFRPVDICAAGFGAPHIRQRLFFHAEKLGVLQEHSEFPRLEGLRGHGDGGREPGRIGSGEAGPATETGGLDGMADLRHREHCGRDRLRHSDGVAEGAQGAHEGSGEGGDEQAGQRACDDAAVCGPIDGLDKHGGPGPTNGLWRAADWLFCRDQKWRPVEPGTFPLAYGTPSTLAALSPGAQELARLAGLDGKSLRAAQRYRVGTTHALGNAINLEVATGYIRSVLESSLPSKP